MPLPEGGKTCWPPAECGPINAQIATWAAWYSGSVDQLSAIYGGTQNGAGAEFFASEKGGFKATATRALGWVRRWFWGHRNTSGQPSNRLHVPIAGDIAAASADLLFSEPPTVTVDVKDKATQERLDELLDDGTHATWLEGAEIAAALGGVYMRVCWDPKTRPDRPWIGIVHPDAAVPEWSFNHLTAVTFWRIIKRTKKTVVRHLERHEPGVVMHGVYEGEDDELGMPVPFTDYPETAWLADQPLENGNEVPTGIDIIAAAYVPNMRPNRVWRDTPGASALGRSDYAGVEPLMDGLDLTYSSLIRDVELGKARLIVPAEYMENLGPGQGARVDLDRELYEPVNVMGGDEGKSDITMVQFPIRIGDHRDTIHTIKSDIVGSAGYSAQTFGLDTEGSAMTATEVTAKNRRSLITRDRKIRYWRPEQAHMIFALLGIDVSMFGTPGIVPQRPMIEFPDGVSEDPKTVAETLALLTQAEAISTEEKVKTLHPDWEDTEVQAEVKRIHDEQGVTTAPLGDGTGNPGADPNQPPQTDPQPGQ